MAQVPTSAEVQSLRGRCLQLEAELAAAANPTHTVSFIGSSFGYCGWTGDIGSPQPFVGNAAPTAHLRATTELTKWKTANPSAVILSEEHSWSGLEPRVRPDNYTVLAPTLVILVKYRIN
jgi:hypothetical protein